MAVGVLFKYSKVGEILLFDRDEKSQLHRFIAQYIIRFTENRAEPEEYRASV